MNARDAARIADEAVNAALDAGHIAYETRFRKAVAAHLALNGVGKHIAGFDARVAIAIAVKRRRAIWAERLERSRRRCELAYATALIALVDELIEDVLDEPGRITSVAGCVTRVRRAVNDRMEDTYTEAEDTLWTTLYGAGYRYEEASNIVYGEVHRSAVTQVMLASRIRQAAASRSFRLARKVAA